MGFQLCSKNFETGPSKLGNVVCQMENQTESRKKQSDLILQVHTRQKNRTEPKTVWRDTKSLSSSEISGNYFDSQLSFKKHFEDILDRCNTRYHCLRLLANKKWGPSPSTLIQIYKQCVQQIFEYSSFLTIATSDISSAKFNSSKTSLSGLLFVYQNTFILSSSMTPLAFHM